MNDKKYRILHIDDEASFQRQMKFVFHDKYEFIPVRDIQDLKLKAQQELQIDLVLLDLVLDDTGTYTGLSLIESIKSRWPSAPIIAVTQSYREEIAHALNNGVNSYLSKSDFDIKLWGAQFEQSIKDKYQKDALAFELKREKEKNTTKYVNPINNPFIGNSRKMELIRKTLKGLAEDPEATILITGETGVGKGVAARFFHANSVRFNKPFEDIYISNIPRDLIPSELFGAKKGAFTGAIENSKGRLAEANGGIVLLDEIGDLDYDTQTMLLQFLQYKVVRQIGPNTKNIKLDVQIITATNKNLEAKIDEGNFRGDLYYRINDFVVDIPPLRERREDILPLLMHFFKKPEKLLYETIDQDVLDFLLDRCSWKGNIRQLEKAVKQMNHKMGVLETKKITLECLPDDLYNEFSGAREKGINPEVTGIQQQIIFASLNEEIAYKKLSEIEKALNQRNGKKRDVARLLNYKSDDNLRYAVEKYLQTSPRLIQFFPTIQESYYRLIKKLKY